ncbi:hypothetical protein E0500_013840 [Streptomyces sp. KM273126]|nr:hypothetical protein [Streptomyces sp. KM273126]
MRRARVTGFRPPPSHADSEPPGRPDADDTPAHATAPASSGTDTRAHVLEGRSAPLEAYTAAAPPTAA